MSVSLFSHLPFSRHGAGSCGVPQHLFLLSVFADEQRAISRARSLEAASALRPSGPPSLWPRANKMVQFVASVPAKQCNFCAVGTMHHPGPQGPLALSYC